VFAHNLSIDEHMVPYFGRHTCKMFMQGKHVRFGFKIWCIFSSDGYLFNFIPYAGRNDSLDPELGLGGGVVMQLLSVVSNPLQYAIYFDNFFLPTNS
jgi:Transposase IS4